MHLARLGTCWVPTNLGHPECLSPLLLGFHTQLHIVLGDELTQRASAEVLQPLHSLSVAGRTLAPRCPRPNPQNL